MTTADAAATEVLEAARREFASLRTLAERAAAQLDDERYFRAAGDGGNSVALLMKHVGGNLRSRWTEFLTADGEKPDRHRDTEFELADTDTRARIGEGWDAGWAAVAGTLASLAPADLARTVTIRAERLPAARALLRSLAHTAGHVHQIVLLARQWQGDAWQTLSIPRGGSDQFLRAMTSRHGAAVPPTDSPERGRST